MKATDEMSWANDFRAPSRLFLASHAFEMRLRDTEIPFFAIWPMKSVSDLTEQYPAAVYQTVVFENSRQYKLFAYEISSVDKSFYGVFP